MRQRNRTTDFTDLLIAEIQLVEFILQSVPSVKSEVSLHYELQDGGPQS